MTGLAREVILLRLRLPRRLRLTLIRQAGDLPWLSRLTGNNGGCEHKYEEAE